MGLSYKGGATHYHSLTENITSVTDKYPLTNGFFGTKGQSNDNRVRNITSSDPQKEAQSFYNSIAHGGIEVPLFNKNGEKYGATTKLADGTIITWRTISSSDGSPAVDINIKHSSDKTNIKHQKIHFVKE